MFTDELGPLAACTDGALIALDFDGTLAPLVENPAESKPAPGAVRTLSRLSEAGAQIAIVTGRDAVTARDLGGLDHIDNLVISGLHGAETYQDHELTTRAEPAGIQQLREQLPAVLATIDEAIWLEDKRLSIVVHTRRCSEPAKTLALCKPAIAALVADAGLELHPGHLVVEIRMPGISKADAITELITPDTTAALYAGDDHGDVPAMNAVTEWGKRTGRPAVTIAVGSLQQLPAQLRVPDPGALVSLLASLLPTR
jgi:trehalose 6-phosphate phosphatase